MINITISEKVKGEYRKTIKKVFLTPKKKQFTAKAKRFYSFLKDKSIISKFSEIRNFLINDNIHSLIREHGTFTVDEKDYDIYDDFRTEWANKLVALTNVKVCPYCNRNFIVNFNNKSTTVELDHFFPKSKYPYLAINLYNLIASCHTCNHKKDSKKLKIYPYKESFNDYMKFSLQINKLPFNEDNIELLMIKKKNTRKDRKKINNYNKVLNIYPLYQNHKDIVLELIQKNEIYNDSYIDELMATYEGTLFKNREDLLRLITCGYINDEDINKRPLSKLIKDISEELELI